MGGHGEILPILNKFIIFTSTLKLGGQITISFLIVPALFVCLFVFFCSRYFFFFKNIKKLRSLYSFLRVSTSKWVLLKLL